MTDPKGTVLFSTVGRTNYGFDVFSLTLTTSVERRLTDGVSINFNARFVQDEDDHSSVVFVSERSGSPRIYLTRPGQSNPVHLPFIPQSLFHDRPIMKNDRLYFISAHEQPDRSFKNWPALYSCHRGNDQIIARLTPYGVADYSPAISESGKFIAVASYGTREWGGEFHQLNTDIVVLSEIDPNTRHLVCEKGGWPTWSGDSTIYFHRQTDDGCWSIFRIDLPKFSNPDQLSGCFPVEPVRITPPGVHCFTPAAFHDNKRLAVATRRRGQDFRHIEIFDVESNVFQTVTGSLNPSFHHYNPSVSPDGGSIVYHRFRGESAQSELIPQFERVTSPTKDLRLLRINGNFPAFSAAGDLAAFNHDFDRNGGVKVVRSDGSRRWTLIKGRTAFYNAWNPVDSSVIFTSLGPIFESAKATVQIARITFDPSDLNDDREEEVPCEVKMLTRDDTGNNAFPSVSPDGKSLVFRSGRSGDKNLFIVDAVNGEFDGGIRQLTNGPWIDTMPSWSPRGDLIAFSSNRHNPDDPSKFSIYTVKPDGSEVRRIYVAAAGSDRERINHVCFSEDGEWLLFAANLGGVTAEPVSLPNQFQPYGDLFVTRVDGSGFRRLTWNGYENGTPAWHPKPDLPVELGSLSLEKKGFDKLLGDFQEPLWITSDF